MPHLPLQGYKKLNPKLGGARDAASAITGLQEAQPQARRCEGCRICHYLSLTDSICFLQTLEFGCCISKGSLFRLFTNAE